MEVYLQWKKNMAGGYTYVTIYFLTNYAKLTKVENLI